jgi:hypothetical protein
LRGAAGLLLLVAALLSGCVPAIEPFYTAEDLVYDPSLVGTWNAPGSVGTWHVARSGEKTFVLTHESHGTNKTFEGHLFQLGAHRFLDLEPRIPIGEGDVHWAHYLPLHTVLRVWVEGDTLRLSPLSRGWLDRELERGERSIAHRRTTSGVVLTGSTTELRDLLREIADDPRAFPPPEHCAAIAGARTLCIDLNAPGIG